MFGGLIFRPLTYEYLTQYENAPYDLATHALYQNVVTSDRRQVILLAGVLPNPVNRGYEEMEDFVVDTVNGVIPRDMRHLAEIIDGAPGPWLHIVTEDRSFMTLSLDEARAAQENILTRFGIARDRSPDLMGERAAELASAE